MKLDTASPDIPEGLEEFLLELGDGENGFGGTDFASGKSTLAELLQRLVDMAAGGSLSQSQVPMTTFWLFDAVNRIVGMSRLRHKLNAALLAHGGHIDYYIRPSERRKGYGRALLRLALHQARSLGLKRVLLTVDSDNIGSIGVIERNGGRMEDERHDDAGPYRRYWIELDG